MEPLSPEEEQELLALCDTGQLYAVEAWVRGGRSLIVSSARSSPLAIALQRGFHSLVEFCLRHETSQAAKSAALARAVADRRADLAELAVHYGADVRSVPFADALYSWNRRIAALFLAHGADPVADHPFAWAFYERIRTALGAYLDCRRARPDLAGALQAQLDMALRKHAHDGHLKWVSLLMWAGGDPRSLGPMIGDPYAAEDDEELFTTALRAACYGGHPEVLKRLRPNPTQDDLGQLLEEAARWGHLECVQLLLNIGARVTAIADSGSRALDGCLWQLGWEYLGASRDAAEHGVPPPNACAAFALLVAEGAVWRPDPGRLRDVRRVLYDRPLSVTLDILTPLVRHHACDDDVLRQFLRPPKMQQHLAPAERDLRRLGLSPDGRRLPPSLPASATKPKDRHPSWDVLHGYDREQLYREVWAEPMRTVAARYGVSDVRLAVICGQLQIPKPPRGYWAQRAAGHKGVPTPPLKPLKAPAGRQR